MLRYVLVFIFLVVPITVLASSADVQLLKLARSQIKVIAGELRQRVADDLRDRGAVAAMMSCRLNVDGITDRLSDVSGWEIRRVAFKVRNSGNRPDAWEAGVLELFAKRKAEGVDMTRFEFAKVVNMDGKRVFRYMKPIIMQGTCLSCHGENMLPGVAEKIREAYPEDEAYGYRSGDLRGAFSMLRVLPGDPPR